MANGYWHMSSTIECARRCVQARRSDTLSLPRRDPLDTSAPYCAGGRHPMQIVTTANHGRRWLDHYRTVPSTFEPASRTGLEMFRATVLRARDAIVVHYFE